MDTFEMRQIVVVHEHLWNELDEWARRRRTPLVRMPTGSDGVLTYCFTMAG